MEVLFHNNPQTLDSPMIPAKVQTQTQTQSPIPLSSLVSSLELAAQSTRTLASASPDETLAVLSSLRSTHHLIGSFLSQIEANKAPDTDEPMRDRGDEEEGEGFGVEGEAKIIEEVEEGMRGCVLQSKRRKRQVSSSWLAGRSADRGEELSSVDPMDRRRSALDLVFQFHA